MARMTLQLDLAVAAAAWLAVHAQDDSEPEPEPEPPPPPPPPLRPLPTEMVESDVVPVAVSVEADILFRVLQPGDLVEVKERFF